MLQAIGKTVSCKAYFSRVCCAIAHDVEEACLLLFGSLRCKMLPSMSSPPRWRRASLSAAVSDARGCLLPSSTYRQFSLVGFCKSPSSYAVVNAVVNVENPSRAELVFFLKFSFLRKVLAILARFVYLDTRKRTTVRSHIYYVYTYIYMHTILAGECIALLASGSEERVNWDLPSMLELFAEAMLAYFSGVSFALRPSPMTSRRRVSCCSAVSDARHRLLRALLHGGGVLPAIQHSPT